MSDLTNRTAAPTGDQPSKNRSRITWGAAAALGAAGIAAGLFLWKPWADEAPFTATISSASTGSTTDGERCTPNLAGKPIVIYDKAGKHKLAEGVTSKDGERLPDSFGDFAGYCFDVTRVEGVPGGRGSYQVQVGGGNMTKVTEEDLRRPADAQREQLKTTKMPDDDESATQE
ncbi:hypothetical protein ACR820_03015 [Streptomyces netropsis]